MTQLAMAKLLAEAFNESGMINDEKHGQVVKDLRTRIEMKLGYKLPNTVEDSAS